jgi:LysM repeat protein
MLLIQSLSSGRNATAWRVIGCLSLAAVLVGCATSGADVASTPAPASVDDGARTEVAPQMTATEAAVAANPEGAPSEATVPPDRPVVNATAPTEYTVKRGDTLWDIAAMFLRDPWLWPEIWQVNQQVKNPHLIYPGDVLSLAYAANGDPQVRLTRGGGARLDPLLRSSELDGAIATIPYSAIAAFLERPTVLSKEQVKDAPRVLAFRNEHMIGGAGIEAYIRGLNGAQQNSRYSVVHVGDEIRDPDDGDVIGYQGTYTATAVILNPGETAKAALTDSARETLEGDRLFGGDSEVPLNFMPRSPGREISGQIVSVIDGVTVIGQYKIVAINRGRRHGLEPGHVLAIDEAGVQVRDRHASRLAGMKLGSAFAPRVQLPNERNGTLLVFRVFDRMSYGLIVSASNPVRIADVVRTPY